MADIRAATTEDAEAWQVMRSALWPQFSEDHPAEIQAYFAGESIDIEQAYVLQIGEELAGFIELNIRNFAEGSRRDKVPYLEAWYIKPEYQHRGHGRQLMQQAEQWALEQGFTELASDTEVVNERSIHLHKQLGFEEVERVVCFLKSLEA